MRAFFEVRRSRSRPHRGVSVPTGLPVVLPPELEEAQIDAGLESMPDRD